MLQTFPSIHLLFSWKFLSLSKQLDQQFSTFLFSWYMKLYELHLLWCHFQLLGDTSGVCGSVSRATVSEPAEKEEQTFHFSDSCPRNRTQKCFFLIFNCYIPNSCSTLQTFHSTPMCHSTPAENCWFRVWSWKRAHLKILINLKVSCWLILSAFCLYGFEYKHLSVHLDTFISKTKNRVHGPKLCLLSL